MPRLAQELVLIALAALVYGGVRAVTEQSVAQAVSNGRALLRLEQHLGLAWEAAFQDAIIDHSWLVTLANWMYIFGHWPVIAAVAAFLYARRRESYRLLRDAVFVSGAIGFAFFALLPVAPPRLIDAGLVDTVVERSHAYRALQPSALTNEYAALPSLHFGWNLLVGIVLFSLTSNVLVKLFAVAMPAAMAFSVVATANHYVLDVFVAAIVVTVGLLVSRRLHRETAATLVGDEIRLSRRRDPSLPRRASRRKRPRPAALR
ncbi:MAG TPA: phosphatase PAP2 family protein [Gaiellaceae bacterium]